MKIDKDLKKIKKHDQRSHPLILKQLRSMAKNKEEYEKAKAFSEKHIWASFDKDGNFDRIASEFLAGIYEYKDPDICKRCGKCCYLQKDGKFTDIPCPHLEFNEDGTTTCQIYSTRLRTQISDENICIPRIFMSEKFPGCPYNDILEGRL